MKWRRTWRVGDFELCREIGRGGMGVVYEAHDVKLKRRVALKMIKAGDLASPQEVDGFGPRPRRWRACSTRNIVQIYAVGEHDGRPYLALELHRRRQPGGPAEGQTAPPCRRGAPGRDAGPGGAFRPPVRHHPSRSETRERPPLQGRPPGPGAGDRHTLAPAWRIS